MVLRRGRIKEICAISLIPPPQGGGGGGGGVPVKKKKKAALSQLRALATHTPSLGRVGQGTWELGFTQIGGAIF